MKSALLLSGGQDSVALAYWLRPAVAISIDYGQLPAEAELRAASQICETLCIQHLRISVDCSSIGSGDLSGAPPNPLAPSSEWWPYRNQLLITLAASSALAHGAAELLLGAVSTDASHTDGGQAFFDAMDRLLSIQEGGIRVRAPAIHLTSAQLIRQSGIPLDLLFWAHSCHRSNFACGQCRGCTKHRNVMYELGHEPF
ncbi:7-cyano-7-deazaguanine synthase [Burkholderia arboris]|uniref:7-cyano-7-deazaguanine synthase n=1 Tax=Burkholderia arboris TaxID=488730 RepID=UPI00210A38E8|nr:7-cyano-7-deazaguanine synthase [Burkholderia arboris]UTV59571.1 7-cyano-7-deazaguanine synthase [Burkholderia arboris]